MTLLLAAPNGLLTILMLVGMFMLFSMLIQRPLKKQQAEAARLREGLAEGNRVVLTSGFFGTITHVGTEQVVVELAPGTEVTAMKTAVVRVVGEGDEEFAFADDGPHDEELADDGLVGDEPAKLETTAPMDQTAETAEPDAQTDFARPITRAE